MFAQSKQDLIHPPNFASPINYLSPPQFGYSTQTLNAWLGGGVKDVVAIMAAAMLER